jgi:hypothetical protein
MDGSTEKSRSGIAAGVLNATRQTDSVLESTFEWAHRFRAGESLLRDMNPTRGLMPFISVMTETSRLPQAL